MDRKGTVKLYGLVMVLVMSMLVAVAAPSVFHSGLQNGDVVASTTIEGYKAANGFWEQRVDYNWTVTKTVSEEAIALKTGESTVLQYQIEVVRFIDKTTNIFGVFGGVYVINNGLAPTEGLAIVDTVYYSLNGGESYDELVNNPVDVSAKSVLQPGESFTYAYQIQFEPVVDAIYLNTASISITNGGAPIVTSDSFSLPTSPTVIRQTDSGAQLSDAFDVPAGWSIDVSDVGPWDLTDSGTVNFEVTVTNDNAMVGSTDELVNTASLIELDTQVVRTSTVTVDLTSVGSACINVTKTGPMCAWEGKTVKYTITVTNCGEVDLTSVVVDDQMAGFLQNIPLLLAGASVSWDVEMVIPDLPHCVDHFCNMVTATGWYFIDGQPVEFVHDNATWCLIIWHPGMEILKSTDNDLLPEGHSITYYYTVYNTGDSPLFDVRVFDDKLGWFEKADFEEGNGTLLSGDSWSFCKTTTIPVTEDIQLWTLCNVATAYGDICDGTWTACTECCVDVIDPRIEVTKWSPYDMMVEDHSIPYFINVTNTGNYALDGVYISDSLTGDYCLADYQEDGTLAPGETWYLEFSYYLCPESGLECLCNDVTAYGHVCHACIQASASWCIDIVHPSIEVTKWAPYEMLTEGHTVTYYINVTNTGDVDLQNVRVYDDMMKTTFCLVDYQADGTLAPGETWYLMVDYTIPVTDATGQYPLCNEVTAYGDICHTTIEASAQWCIQIVHPMILIEKCCEYDMLLEGHMQEFKIIVTNTGDVALENVRVYDELLQQWFNLDEGTLGVGQSWCFSFSWEVPMTMLNEQYTIWNNATAYGDLCHGTVNDTDGCSFVIVHPCICVEKTVDGPIDGMIIEGHTVIYTVTVCNCGDVALSDVKVYDDLLGAWFYYDSDDNEVPMCLDDPPIQQIGDTLYPGECWTFTYEYTVPCTQEIEPWMLCNNVTAYGFLCHQYVTDIDTVCIEIVHPNIEVTKWSPFTMAIEGHEVWWIVNVTNSGDVALDQVVFYDSVTNEQYYLNDNDGAGNGTLQPGEIWSFTIFYTVPFTDVHEPYNLCNTVTAYGYLCHDYVVASASWCIEIVHPCIDIQKSVNYDMIVEGHSVLWTITVTNCGDVALENVRVYDELIDKTFYMCDEVPTSMQQCDGTLLPGQVWQFSFCYEIPYTEITHQYCICNNATVYADICHVTLEDKDTACVTVVHPCICVTKETPFSMAVEGHDVYWYVNVTNCGDVALDDVRVYDDLLKTWFYYGDPVVADARPVPVGDTLNPGETWNFMVYYTVPYTKCEISEPYNVCNEVTAYGDICHTNVSDGARSCILIVNPSISVDKCCEPGVAVEGQSVNFTVVVKNTGNVALDNVYFYDNILNTTYCLADYQVDGTLAPGESWTLVIQWTIPFADPDVSCYHNVATAYGQLCHAWYSDQDCCCINVVHPSIEIDKWSPYVMMVEDHTIPYYLNVTNTGDVGLNNVRIYDTMFGWLYLYEMVDDSDGMLMPGEWWNITLSHYVEVTGLDHVYNICNMATVYGDVCMMTFSDSDCWCIEIFHPSIDIVKTADATMALEGSAITYTITVTNTGDSLLHDVCVSDSMFDTFYLDQCQADGTLNPGEVWQFTIPYIIPDNSPCPEVWEISNTATAYGDLCHGTLTDTDSWCIKVVHPAIDIVKEVNCCSAEAGDTVTYTFYVTNTGDVGLDNVTITDERIGYVNNIGHLDDGMTVKICTDWVVPCDIKEDPFCNRAVVNGYVIMDWSYQDVMVSDCDCARLDIIHPSLTILKYGPDQAAIGDIVIFSVYVQNTGDVPLKDIHMVDGCYQWCIRSLDIGQEKCFLVPVLITGCMSDPFVNVACGSGWYYDCPCNEMREIKSSGEWTVDIIHPSIELDKSAPETAVAGSCIQYTFTVTNNGDVPLTGVVIEDEMLGLRMFVGDMCVGETRTLTACYEVPDNYCQLEKCCPGDDGCFLKNKAEVTGFYQVWKVYDKDTAITEIIPPQCCPN